MTDSIRATQDTAPPALDDEDWEEWDGRSPFWVHCVAGSLAGVAEHTLVYPLDTVRTHIQVCASCVKRGVLPSATSSLSPMKEMGSVGLRNSTLAAKPTLPTGMWQTIRYLMNEPAAATVAVGGSTTAEATTLVAPGIHRLWRGVQAIMIGCVPAHALYFSSYEMVKAATSTQNPDGSLHVTALSSSLAGATAVCAHDLVMTPLDTIKQRMQLGHYDSVSAGMKSIVRQEGWKALYRSFPITLASNVPYGAIMVSVNEYGKQAWADPDRPAWQTILLSSSMAGLVASAVTTPLDRIKTSLQTQQLVPACQMRGATAKQCRLMLEQQAQHANWRDAAMTIWKEEGARGFFRGVLPRILSHTPAVAISWSTYEAAKHYLLSSTSHL